MCAHRGWSSNFPYPSLNTIPLLNQGPVRICDAVLLGVNGLFDHPFWLLTQTIDRSQTGLLRALFSANSVVSKKGSVKLLNCFRLSFLCLLWAELVVFIWTLYVTSMIYNTFSLFYVDLFFPLLPTILLPVSYKTPAVLLIVCSQRVRTSCIL
jgi:hypothetical protein